MAYLYPPTHTQDKRHSSQMVDMYTSYDKEAEHLTVPSKSKKSSDSSSSVFSSSSFSSKRQLLKSKLSSSGSSSKRSSKKSEKEYLDHTAFNHIWNR